MATYLAILLKPIILLLFLGVLLFVRYAVIWWVPEGKLKRLLLLRVERTDTPTDQGRTPTRPKHEGKKLLPF